VAPLKQLTIPKLELCAATLLAKLYKKATRALNMTIHEETASATWRHVPTQSNPADLISRGFEVSTLSNSTLWWKRPQWLTQKPSSWPTAEFNSPLENLEIRNVHIAVQTPEDIQRFSRLNRLISHCILQEIYKQLQTYQGQQAKSHSDHTRSGPGCDSLC
jgi:hypothetical protein